MFRKIYKFLVVWFFMKLEEGAKGKFVIVVGPSGSGKSTMLSLLLKKYPEFKFSVSATTRDRREGEVDGVDYYFLSKEEFESRIENDDFFEYDCHFDNYYGTLKSPVVESINNSEFIFSDIEFNGMLQAQSVLSKENLVSIFFMPPCVEDLIKRIKQRGEIGEDELKLRLDRVEKELSYKDKTDFVFCPVNNDIEKSFELFEELVLNCLK